VRVTIYLPDEQVEFLKVYCQEQGVSRAEAIRQAISLLLKEKADSKARLLDAVKAAAGSWQGEPKDGLEYQLQIRAEWDRDDRAVSQHLGEVTS
jgi:Arc/MetJ-type ribon-helix-helix transcriptional regulator